MPSPLPSSDQAAEAAAGLRAYSLSLPMALLRAREAVMQQFRPNLRRHGVTEQQWRVLRALQSHGALEVTELARATCLLPPSLSRILRDLEARGLVSRHAVDNDLRRARISIARDGTALIKEVAPDSEAIYAEITRRFGAARLAELQKQLAALEAALADMGGEAEGDGPEDC